MDELVERLQNEQPIAIHLRPTPDVAEFRAAIERRLVHVLFERTGTELGVRVDVEQSKLADADFEAGTATLVGDLVLNYDRVRFHGAVDPSTLKGVGRIEYLGAATTSFT